MDLFYSSEIFEHFLMLSMDESGHCTRVMRKVSGDRIRVLDGKGNVYEGLIELQSKNKPIKVWIQSKISFPNTDFQSGFHLAIAPTKNSERMEWLVEKTVELGLQSITFLQCDHSERINLRMDRLEKIAISALKQSQQYWMPIIKGPTSFNSFISEINLNDNGYIAHCLESEKSEFGYDLMPKSCHMLIGPEGDFSESEIKQAIARGFKPVSLGKSRLRTETAALYACAVYKSKQSK